MGESQEKASSSGNSMEKSSLIDFDIGKDFLSNWKPKSGGKDDIMDLDFGPVTKNKKKMFDFDKVDIDFNLDGDFGSLSSFKIDMSDFDVSSPLKRDGKHKEKSKEVSGRGSTKAITDSFDFSFDFNKLGNFTFEASPRKGKDASKDEDQGGSLGSDDSESSRIRVTEEIAVEEDGLCQKSAASGAVSSSDANLQDDGRAHLGSTTEDLALKSVGGNDGPSKFITAIQEVVPTEQSSLQKLIPIRIQQKGCQPEKTSSTGPVTPETCDANATEKTSSAGPVIHETCAASATTEKTSSAGPVTEKTCAANATPEKASSAGPVTLVTCAVNATSEKTSSAGLVTRENYASNATLPEQSEKTSSAGPIIEKTCAANSTLPETSVYPASGTDSSGDTASELQEEVSSMAIRKNIADEEHDVNPPCSTEQANRSTSDSCRNPKPLLPTLESVQIVKNTSPEEKDTIPKVAHMMPGLPGMKLSRSDSFAFKSNPRGSENAMEDQDKGGSPISVDCKCSRIHLAEDTSVHDDGISLKPIISGTLRSSDNNLQTSSKAHLDSANEECRSSRIHLAEEARVHEDGISQKSLTLGALKSSENSLQTSSKAHLESIAEECQSSRIRLAEEIHVHEDGISQKPITLGALRSSDNNLQTNSKAILDSICEECQSSRIHLAEEISVHEDSIFQKPITSGALGSSDNHSQTTSKAHLESIAEECQSSRIHLAEEIHDHEDGISQKPITLGALRSSDNNLQTNSKAILDSICEECQSSRIHLAEDLSVHEDSIFQKPITSGALGSSDNHSQTTSKAHLGFITKGVTLMSVRSEKGPSESVTTTTEVMLRPEEASTLQPSPTRIRQTGCQPEKMSSAESVSKKACAANKITPDITVCSASTSDNCANAKILLPNVASRELMRNTSLKGENSQPARKTPSFTGLKISRTFEGNRNASRAMLEKETKSMGTLTPSKLPLREMPPKVSQLTNPQSHSLPTMSLKRKTPEPPDADRMISNPSKRLSESPSESRNTMETSKKFVDEEVSKKLANQNAALENCHAYPNIPHEMNLEELESSYAIEDHSNIQKAEACSKELENMCNMLRKKHEEAKEILVRAIVNNNNLLMLNHPLYEEKVNATHPLELSEDRGCALPALEKPFATSQVQKF